MRRNQSWKNQNVSFSSDFAYDSIANNLVKSRLSASEAEVQG